MSNQLHLVSFNIDAWSANSLGIQELAAWEQWSQTHQWPEDETIESGLIPPMMRRRMSPLSKLAVQTAIHLLQQEPIDYLVFSSRHGELHRSAELIKNILAGEEASPMNFSQSVHNTAAGLTTIATKKAIPVTSIAAGENTFHSALIEAWLYLKQYPSAKVLLVDFDQPLPEDYSVYEDKQFKGYALGLILSAGNTWQVAQCKKSASITPLPQALCFLTNYLCKQSHWIIEGERTSWEWQQA
ncbi:beta-ketoacyl synthase chain length factor [Vibrio diazotrophicus]|uniref:beta-ketoacyl synthase chain length factor n=1 Tax=Vibrio diazotrophicus TaxID=685 RepID=UPI00142DCA4A|nr:beta-ketoacyl synthase chain length factor [Vibrio diazotrophicus]NIY91002.1 beta-ketoacyl synthase chain length factor [Vibrio diazotrophicus]